MIPHDVQCLIVRKLPIDLRVALKVKPTRLVGAATEAVCDAVQRMATIARRNKRCHISAVYLPDPIVKMCSMWSGVDAVAEVVIVHDAVRVAVRDAAGDPVFNEDTGVFETIESPRYQGYVNCGGVVMSVMLRDDEVMQSRWTAVFMCFLTQEGLDEFDRFLRIAKGSQPKTLLPVLARNYGSRVAA